MRHAGKERGPRNAEGVVLSYVEDVTGCSDAGREDAARAAVGVRF